MGKEQATKTHWLQSPNKNYLGHWDLPGGNDLILTIKSAQWEEIKNPITNNTDSKRVIRFTEEDVKPMICNQTNAQSILDCTGEKFMEDCEGKKVQLYVSTTRVKRDDVDCLRVRKMTQAQLQPQTINQDQVKKLEAFIDTTTKTKDQVCKVLNIESIDKVPANKFQSVIASLEKFRNGNT